MQRKMSKGKCRLLLEELPGGTLSIPHYCRTGIVSQGGERRGPKPAIWSAVEPCSLNRLFCAIALLEPLIEGRQHDQREQRRTHQTADHDNRQRPLNLRADAFRQRQGR